MAYDYFSIGTDSDFQFKRATVQKFQPDTMLNDMKMPCEGCSNEETCAAKILECTAFRTWSVSGKYIESNIQRLVRGAKQRNMTTSVRGDKTVRGVWLDVYEDQQYIGKIYQMNSLWWKSTPAYGEYAGIVFANRFKKRKHAIELLKRQYHETLVQS